MEPMSGSPMVLFHRKMKRLKQCLKTFNKVHYSDLPMKVKAKRLEPDRIQVAILSNNSRGDYAQLEKTFNS